MKNDEFESEMRNENQMWMYSPNSRKRLVLEFAYGMSHSWALKMHETPEYENLTLWEIHGLTREAYGEKVAFGENYPRCEYRDSSPGYSYVTPLGATSVFIPFYGEVALRLTMLHRNGMRLIADFNENGEMLSYDLDGEGAWSFYYPNAWGQIISSAFPNRVDYPRFPARIG